MGKFRVIVKIDGKEWFNGPIEAGTDHEAMGFGQGKAYKEHGYPPVGSVLEVEARTWIQLVYTATQQPVNIGDKVYRDGKEVGEIDYIQEPRHSNSTGRVGVKEQGGFLNHWFPGVIDAEWIGREDQEYEQKM